MAFTSHDRDGCSAWMPGVRPAIPHEFRGLETIFRPESVFGNADEVVELARFTGLQHEELTAFRPRRLALHELIVRVTAHIAVEEGEEEEAFGHNFRHATLDIWNKHVLPQVGAIEQCYSRLRQQVDTAVRAILQQSLFGDSPAPASTPFPVGLFRRRRAKPESTESGVDRNQRIIDGYRTTGQSADDPLLREIYRSLHRVMGSIAATSGYVGSNLELLAGLTTVHVCNRHGSQLIGDLVTPLIDSAIEQDGYMGVRTQAAPVLFSLKGASAAGKSSLRPMLKQTMRTQGIAPDSYVTISPDIWRRLLLDFDSLGRARKYAGHLTGREVALIDGKLDRYIRDKANREGGIPHLMVDRFRFDSFSSDMVPRVLDATYAKYVDSMYMYFVITPPEETVERGWQRALERGRYKAVEDFLGHGVEAYSGMPRLLFKWLAYQRPQYRYFIMDNRVPKGTFPRVCAFGDQENMTIYDPAVFVNIERYQKVNIHAASPGELYPPSSTMAIANNLGFLKECVRRLPVVTFASASGNAAYLRVKNGLGKILCEETLKAAMDDRETAEILRLLASSIRCALPSSG